MKAFGARGSILLALLALLVFAAPAGATVARFLSMAEHADLSQLIVRVRGNGSNTFVSEKDGRPRTDHRYTILETYKGTRKKGEEVIIRQMRGATGESMLRIPGDPELAEGQEAVLFLVVDEGGTAYLTALAQSRYQVSRDRAGAWVKRNFDGLAFTMGDDGKVVEAEDEAAVPLELFGETIRMLVKGR